MLYISMESMMIKVFFKSDIWKQSYWDLIIQNFIFIGAAILFLKLQLK
jgi:hypothetical protein